MPIILLLVLTVLMVVLLGPQWWVRHVLERHGVERPDLPGTGGELARHLLDAAGLHGVKVDLAGDGAHYEQEEPAGRLCRQHHDGRCGEVAGGRRREEWHAAVHAARGRAS